MTLDLNPTYMVRTVCSGTVRVAHKSGPGRCLQHQTGTYTDNLTSTGVVHD